jgi:hypothetical protein
MSARLLIGCIVIATCLAGVSAAQAAVHSREQLAALMAAGQTALDALTPHGKRAFLDSLSWGQQGLGGFSTAPLVRELNAAQIAGVMKLMHSDEYTAMLTRDLGDSTPLRFAAPSARVEAAARAFRQFSDLVDKRREESEAAGVTRGPIELVRYYHAHFAPYMRPDQRKAHPPADLLLLFDVASAVVATAGDPQALLHQRAIFAEFERRGIDTRRTLDDAMLRALLAGRRFGEARVFADAHPRQGRQAIAREIDTLGPAFRGRSVYRFDAAANTLERIAVPLAQGIQVVMVVDAGCHFSEAALQAVGSDADLFARLSRAGLLVITPPRSPVPTRFMAEWNEKYPQLALRAPFNAEQWRNTDVTGVPAFFILENGRVRTRIDGWPGPDQKAVLLHALGR